MSLVVPGSPAAMAGLRFGDQLLTLGSAELAGRTEDRVHGMLRSVICYHHVMTHHRAPAQEQPREQHRAGGAGPAAVPQPRAHQGQGGQARHHGQVRTGDPSSLFKQVIYSHLAFRDGAVSAIAVASTAARNGVLVGDQLVEVNGACVVGLGDREVRRRIEQEAAAVTLTTMPQETFRAMVRGMSGWLVRNKMNHSY